MYDRLPYFFSDQYDLGIEYSGYPPGASLVVPRRSRSREFVAFWRRGSCGGMNVNVWDVAETIQALIASGGVVDEPASQGSGRAADRVGRRPRRAQGDSVVNRLQRLHDAGVSNLAGHALAGAARDRGVFAQLVDDFAVTGATSNPTIFAKAITGSDRYDDQLRTLAPVAGDLTFRSCSLPSRSTMCAARPRCCCPYIGEVAEATATSRSNARRTSPMTPRQRSPRHSTCGSDSISRTS